MRLVVGGISAIRVLGVFVGVLRSSAVPDGVHPLLLAAFLVRELLVSQLFGGGALLGLLGELGELNGALVREVAHVAAVVAANLGRVDRLERGRVPSVVLGENIRQVARQLHGGVEVGAGESRQVLANFQLKVGAEARKKPDTLFKVGAGAGRGVVAKFDQLVKVVVHGTAALSATVVLGDLAQNARLGIELAQEPRLG